jgi:translation initiation factor 6
MHLKKVSINGNPNIGLYGFATDSFCIVGREVPEKLIEDMKIILDVPIYQMTLAGTSLIGVFMAGNENDILIPDIAFDSEKDVLEELSKKHGFKLHIIQTELTALGNNIACSDKGCLISPDFDKNDMEQIKKALGLEVKEGQIAGLPTVGSLVAANKKGCAIHRDAEDFEIDFVSSLLGYTCETATVNMGNPFLKSGILVNTNGFLVGDISGGPEINYLDEIFGFLEG